MVEGLRTPEQAPQHNDRKQILLHLEAALIKDLKKAAVDLDTTASAIADAAIDQWLRAKGLRGSDSGR